MDVFQRAVKVQTRAVGNAVERFVQAVRLASCNLNMKTGGGQALNLKPSFSVDFFIQFL
jgi:hypothetical protein